MSNARAQLEESAIELLLEAPRHDDEPRPTLRGHGNYIFGSSCSRRPFPRRTSSTTSRSGSCLHTTAADRAQDTAGRPAALDRIRRAPLSADTIRRA